MLIGLNGYWLSYSSQSMTDTMSVSLLIGTLYFLNLYLEHSERKHLAFASILALANVMTRYEGWFFMAICTVLIFARSRRVLQTAKNFLCAIFPCAIFALPSLGFIGFWLFYQFLGKGDPLYFVHILTELLWAGQSHLFYHDLGKCVQVLFSNLLLSNGLLWLFPFLEAYAGCHRALFTRFSLLMSAYLLFEIPQLYSGAGGGWVRFYLYLLPLASIGFGVFASHTKNRWLVFLCVMITVFFSIVGLQQNIFAHSKYLHTYGADFGR